MDAINVALQLAFILIFIAVLVRFLRQPRDVHRDLVLVFASVVVLFAVNVAVRVWPELPRGISSLSATALLLQPYLTLRLARHFVHVSTAESRAALAWFAVATLALAVGVRGNVLLTALVVGYFVTVESRAAFLLLRASRTRVGYARTRLRIASGATLFFAVGILVSGAGSAANGGNGASEAATFVARVLALTAGLGYLAAFLPPLALRRLQQRAVAFDIGQSLLAAPVDGDRDSIWSALASSARSITNGPAAIVALGDPPRVRVVDGAPPITANVGETFATPTRAPLAERLAHGEVGEIVVTIESDVGRLGQLIVYPDPGSLFLEDDLVLMQLLAAQAARADERREAMHQQGILASELEDASHELATSRAQLESEARFRAALEAHPGILLVVDPSGRVGYANEQALDSLGYTAAGIARVTLDRLLIQGPTPGQEGQGVGEARRRDGTTFPVDFAVSTFESRGELSSIAVMIDISARIEASKLRDTFIGMLSHELRTPVTAIYGGSQVLLGRGERLDPDLTRDLVRDIAAEAERLHRLIENLLVLARVERGENLVGGEPVLLQRVLPVIVDRERTLWLGTDISVTIQSDLPTVRGHDGYVAQVIRNLLSNAVKYGGTTARIDIVAEGGPDGVTVRVLDDGPGFDRDAIDRLFDLYYRAPGSAMQAPGAGIGLFVCRRIVAALGGDIWARQRPSGGAEFGFRLPIYEADDDLALSGGGRELAAAS
ncbi:MAG: ATP-binding protein [Chloroflexota bacterium]